MDKTESIARRIFGWKLNRWDRWYDYENKKFISTCDFQPEKCLEDAMKIVEQLEKYGYKFHKDGHHKVSFNHVSGTGETLSEAITNAAYSLIEQHSVTETRHVWSQML